MVKMRKNRIEFESFTIRRFEIGHDGCPRIQGATIDGKKREFGIEMHRDTRDNSVGMHVYRHFTDPESQPWFEDSQPWTKDETFGDTE
jgi:hypothetical protein